VSDHRKIPDFTKAGMTRLENVLHKELVEKPIATGRALKAIRDRRLYREAGYRSFDAYCRDRWGVRTHTCDLADTSCRGRRVMSDS
jgi:hypothetical protein